MRDLIFVVLFAFMMLYALKRPAVAVSLWVWVSMFFPRAALYGFGSGIRFNLIVALTAIGVSFIHRDQIKPVWDAICTFLLIFFLHITLTSVLADNLSHIVWYNWNLVLKILLLYVFAVLALNSRRALEMFALAMIIGLAYYGVIEGLKFIKSGGAHKIHGPPDSFLGDRNQLALGLCMAIPLLSYFLTEAPSKYYRWAAGGCMFLFALTIIGTQSRGGFIGLAFLLVMNFFFSKKKMGLAFLYAIGITIAISLISQDFIDRINTINTAAEEDSSFMGRLVAWKVATLIAIKDPFFGAGFFGLQNGSIFFAQADHYYLLDWIPTPDINMVSYAIAAHSIYFQVLSDHGFVGFFIYFGMLGYALLKCIRLSMNRQVPSWMSSFARSLSVSFAVFLLSGAALSFAYNDIVFALLAMVTVLGKLRLMETRARGREA